MNRNSEKYFAENKPQADHGRASVRSGVAYIAARSINMIVQLGSTVLLARLLNPADYGLVAMVFVVLGFAPLLIDFGTTDATVQKKTITHGDASALFWMKAAIAVTLMAICVGGSGPIASFYGEPELVEITIVSSLTLVLAALSSQHFALMRRAMHFRQIVMIDISSNAVSSVIAIAMAFAGWGYWALIAKLVLNLAFSAVGAWTVCRWVPGRPQFTPELRELIRFGFGVTGFILTDNLARGVDRVAIGYFYGPDRLGYYQNSLLLYENLMNITNQLHDVAVSSLSKLRDNVDELKRSWAAALSVLTFYFAPAYACLAVTAEDFVVILLGDKWAPSGLLLCIFAARGIAHIVERTLGWLHVPAGRSDRWMRWGMFSAVCQVAAVLASLPFGLAGVATAHAIVTYALCVPALTYAGKPFGITAMDVLRAAGPQVLAALVALVVGLAVEDKFLSDASRPARLIASSLVCLITYLIVIVGLFRVTAPLVLAYSLVHDFAQARMRRGTSK